MTVSFPTPSSPLTITGDTSNDNFTITENLDGTVTVAPGATHVVPGVGVVPGSTIDTLGVPFTTPGAVSSIIVTLPGTSNYDFVTLTGQGKTTLTTVKNVTITATGANLGTAAFPGLIVNNVDNSGNFVLSDTFSSPPPAGAMNASLFANVDNSTFATLSITQTGCCPAQVELGNDNVPGTVSVSEGVGSYPSPNQSPDKITLDNGDTFGPTTLTQGAGPAVAGYNGSGEIVNVLGPNKINSLLIQQSASGNNNSITVTSLTVASVGVLGGVPPGVTTIQGNGNNDTTSITGVTFLPSPPINLPLPPNVGLANISVTQGSGSDDVASVTSSSVPGSISITQNDVAGNSSPDSATASGDHAGFSGDGGNGNITISQGNAGGNSTEPARRSSHRYRLLGHRQYRHQPGHRER